MSIDNEASRIMSEVVREYEQEQKELKFLYALSQIISKVEDVKTSKTFDNDPYVLTKDGLIDRDLEILEKYGFVLRSINALGYDNYMMVSFKEVQQ